MVDVLDALAHGILVRCVHGKVLSGLWYVEGLVTFDLPRHHGVYGFFQRLGSLMAKPRNTLGDYLLDDEPVAALWPDLLDLVYRDSPGQAHLDRLGDSARVLFDTGFFAGEITNGGISQFFTNSSGNRAHETLAALRAIGAALCVDLLEKALSLFPDGIAPVDRQKRCELLFAFEERDPQFLDELTQIFYKRVDALGSVPEEDLTALELAFMRAHSSDPVAT